MPPDANTLIAKYCSKPGQQSWWTGETAPLQDSPDKMKNHGTQAFIDGRSYFIAILNEIRTLMAGHDANRFFYMTAWWLGLSGFHGPLRIADSWNFVNHLDPRDPAQPNNFNNAIEDAYFDAFPATVDLPGLVNSGVNVRVLPWVLPLVSEELVANQTGIGSVNFHSLVSAVNLRRMLGNERVVLNLLSHTFGAVHCKLVICGDSNGMRAYTSGLDPVESRLAPPGVDDADIVKCEKTRYDAPNLAELNKVCDLLDNNIVSKPLFDVLEQRFATFGLTIPPYAQFLIDRQKKLFDYRIDIRWTSNEWKLTFEDRRDEDDIRTIVYYLKKDKANRSIRIYYWPDGGWHDVGVRVEGRAAGAIHDFFRDMWNEQLTRPVESFRLNNDRIVSHDPTWAQLPVRQPVDLAPNAGKQYVQVLRTVPMMNFTLGSNERGKFLVPNDFVRKFGVKGHRFKIGPAVLRLPVGAYSSVLPAYTRLPIGFAPAGCFEFKVALQKAISEATRYIFVADQGLHGIEIMDWINARLLKAPKLKVILLFGADPADPPNNARAEAMNNHLLSNLPLNNGFGNQPKNVVFYEWTGNAVHCKVTLIDDTWCAIGSANCMRRSLYTDVELSISVLEPPTPRNQLPATPAEEANLPPAKKAPSFVQGFRRDLWAHYCGIPLDPNNRSPYGDQLYTQLLPLDSALSIWKRAWGAAAPGLTLRPEISRQNLRPFPVAGPFDQARYDREDPDSRQAF